MLVVNQHGGDGDDGGGDVFAVINAVIYNSTSHIIPRFIHSLQLLCLPFPLSHCNIQFCSLAVLRPTA